MLARANGPRYRRRIMGHYSTGTTGGELMAITITITITIQRRWADLLKANFFAQPNFLTDNFVQRNGPKMQCKYIKFCRILSYCAKIMIKC